MATSSKVPAAELEEQLETLHPAPVHGDVLDTILSHLPLIHLVPASIVSKSWSRAVYSSLRSSNKLKPWLIVYTQSSRSPYATSAHAYDPASNIWIEIKQPSIKYVSALRSTQSNLIYMLSASKFSFSFDPLHLSWHHATAPHVCRIDPIVSLVGHRVIVAGGACDFEDDSLAVECYDLRTRTWTTCESMPASLKASASSTWLSVTVNNNKLFMTEKHSVNGVTHTFDLETDTWCGPYDLLPDLSISNSVTGFIDGRLVLIGLTVDIDGVNSVKLWEVNCKTFECENVGEMPAVLVEKLKGEDFQISSIEVRLAGNFAYIYKPMGVHEVVTCEFVDGECRWGSVCNAVVNDRSLCERFVFSCSEVGVKELKKAMWSDSWVFAVKS